MDMICSDKGIKSIETLAVFTKTKMNHEWNVPFLQVSLVCNELIPVSFSLIKKPLKLLIWNETVSYFF